MPRKHYTQKGLATSVRLARERHQRIERERVEAEEKRALENGGNPASTQRERRERDYIDCGIAQFEAMLAGHGE